MVELRRFDIDSLNSLYDITGKITDVNTLLINRGELKEIVDELLSQSKVCNALESMFFEEWTGKTLADQIIDKFVALQNLESKYN